MILDIRDTRKIGICFLLLVFIFVTIVLSVDAPPALAAVTFALVLILEILFVFCLILEQFACTAHHCGIRLRSPPNC
jgi:hypothetical protein